jgi:hypothetical protein
MSNQSEILVQAILAIQIVTMVIVAGRVKINKK